MWPHSFTHSGHRDYNVHLLNLLTTKLINTLGYFCRMDQLLIVGGGLAGTVLALECFERGIEFKWVVADHIPAASFAAYGMCNPVHLRNQVPVWKADVLYETSKTFFSKWSNKLEIDLFSPMPVNHLVVDEMEEVKWRQNSEITELWKYTTGEPEHNLHPLLSGEFISEIRIREAFYVNIPQLILKVKAFFKDHIIEGGLEWNEAEINTDHVVFRKQSFRRMILADGVGGMKNPFFQCVPFNPCKGEVLHVKIDGLVVKEAIHKKIILLPLPDRSFLCGATYEWTDLSNETTIAAREELLEHLNIILGGRYKVEVIGQN